MKKNYFFGALMSLALVLFAIPAKAQVASLADLFGKYQFTADMTVTPGMESKAEQLSANCEAVIEQGAIYDAQIVGFAGATTQLNINAISTEKEMIKVTNPNNPVIFDGLYLADENGNYPYGVYDKEKGEWAVESYGPVYMTYNPTTKEISIPDFTVVACDHPNSSATVVAKFTNAKMTLVEAVVVEVADLSGSWHATPLGINGSNSESSIAGEYDFVLTKTGDDNKNYSAELTIEGFAPVTLPATFDGVTLALHAKDVVLDATTGAVIYYYGSTEYDITFSYASENTLAMSAPLCIALPTEDVDDEGNPVTKYTMNQWYMDGTAKRASDAVAFDWAGTWTVVGKEMMSNTDVEFDMVIEEKSGSYFIVSFLGNDVSGINYGGILVTPSADGKSAEIKAGTILKTVEAGVAYQYLYDMSVTASPIQITVNEDGTISIADFAVSVNAWGGAPDPNALVGFYSGLSASKAPEVEPFDWTGTWNVKATENMAQVPAEFTMVVKKYQSYTGADFYSIDEFMGNNTYNLNYGGFEIIPAADGKSATITTGNYIKSIEPGVSYSVIYDGNMGTNPINVTVNADGTLSIDNFSIATNAWGGAAADAKITAYYVGVTASKEVEKEVAIDWTGTWNVKATENMAQVPAEFTMVVKKYQSYTGADFYSIDEFMGNNTYNLNYGGFEIIPAADGKSATITTGNYIKSIEPGVSYSVIYDGNMGTNPINVTVNADGTLSIDNFSIATNAWGGAAADAKITAYYVDVTASKADANAIESVEAADAKVAVNGGVITVAGEAQFVQVYDVAGRLEFSGVASSISNLAKGIHIVKVGGASVKVSVK